MLSTRDLSTLPDIDRLKALTQSLAMLDAILSPDWEARYWSFNSHWAVGQRVASMRDGSGDEMFAWFIAAGVILKGFAHESVMSPYIKNTPSLWPGIVESVPKVFTEFLSEPAFSPHDVTFCVWRTYADTAWQRGNISFPEGTDPDGSGELLQLLDGKPQTYQTWAEEYYDLPVSLSAVAHVYAHHPLTKELIGELNAEISLRELQKDMTEIGYK